MIEQWRAIPGWEGLYEVSNMGRVKSLPRNTLRKDGTRNPRPERIGVGARQSNGYRSAELFSADGTSKKVGVHRLVLLAFVGPPSDGQEACHFDDDKANNRLDNLRWDTRSENLHDMVRNGKHHAAKKTHCKNGHEFVPGSYYIRKNGGRNCRPCVIDKSKKAYERKMGREVA